MNIIEAIKLSEKGSLITNKSLKARNHFLKRIERSLFWQYEIINEIPQYKYEVRDFRISDILASDWEIVEENYFSEITKEYTLKYIKDNERFIISVSTESDLMDVLNNRADGVIVETKISEDMPLWMHNAIAKHNKKVEVIENK